MSANDLLNRLHNMRKEEPIDWLAIREEIHQEADKLITTEERVILLELFAAVFDRVERELSVVDPEKLQAFRNARLKDYRLLIIKEATIGENICADTLFSVTSREIVAGRMSPDDGLHKTAIDGVAVPHYSRAELMAIAEKKRPAKRRFLSWMFRR